jgi:hypothetical protein
MPAVLNQQRVDEILAELDARLAQIKLSHRAALEKMLEDLRSKKLETLRKAFPTAQ